MAPRDPTRLLRLRSKEKIWPPRKTMLANKYDETKKNPTGWLMSEKLDCMRAFWDGYTGMMWSRYGKHICAPDWWTGRLPCNIYLDGNVWLGRVMFQQCMSIVLSKSEPQNWDQVTFIVFYAPKDIINGEKAPGGNLRAYEARHDEAVCAILQASASGSTPGTKSFATVRPYEICRGPAHLQQKLAQIEALNGEGLMLRRPGSRYRGGRSSDSLKVKSWHDDEAVVTGHEAGRGKHTGRLGALQVVNRNGKHFKLGTCFLDQERENPPPIRAVITYRFNELTNAGVPRFPMFVRLRPDVQAQYNGCLED